MLDDRAEARGVASRSTGASAVTVTCFAHVADRELEIEANLLAGREADALAAHGLEARQLDVDAVLARRQARERVDAVAVGHDGHARRIGR